MSKQQTGEFAVYHIHENGNDSLFRSDIFVNTLMAANRYRLYKNGELTDHSATFADAIIGAEKISLKKYSAACDGTDYDQRLSAIYEFDIDSGVISICDVSDHSWKTYSLNSFSKAAEKAYEQSDASYERRCEIFYGDILGKEIDLSAGTETPTEDDGESEAPTLRM